MKLFEIRLSCGIMQFCFWFCLYIKVGIIIACF